jgi:subtilase family serine protease
MEVRTKALVTILLVGAFIGVYTLQGSNSSLFKGSIKREVTDPNAAKLPDLTADLVVIAPAESGGDLSAKVTITNDGTGPIDGKTPFKYTISINNTEVFTNTDSYTSMSSGESFSFTYPVSRAVYQYLDSGTAKVVIDTENKVVESDEENNTKEVSYTL